MKKSMVIGLVIVLACLAGAASGQAFRTKGKKVIEYGWDVRPPKAMVGQEATLEQYPFDGVIYRLDKLTMAFDRERWSTADVEAEKAAVKSLKWKKYKHNFIIVYSAVDKGMNWFDDDHWKNICANINDFSRIARAGKCVGIVFDPEAYGKDPWIYPGDYPDKSYEEVTAKVRQRGNEWMAAVQKGWPNVKVLLFYFSPDSKDTLGAFCTGMVDAAGRRAKIIDGNEPSYYHTSPDGYIADWKRIRQDYPNRIDPKLRWKYDRNVQVGMALYMDQSLALREPAANYLSFYMSPADRLKYFEHSVYWAMKTTDEYVWCYSERLDWWKGTFPRDADEAIKNAKAKLEAGQDLGFDLTNLIRNVRKARDVAISGKSVKPTADIHSLPAGTVAPVIDGKLDDEAWQKTPPLNAFVPQVMAPAGAQAVPTTARATYDDNNLYAAIDCADADMSGLIITGTGKDSNIWLGDTIELFLTTSSESLYDYRHFILNPANAQWDGKAPPDNGDVSWNADWKSAVEKNPTSWSAEIAIPWSALGGKPAPGTIRFANICRQRRASEWSSWSAVVDGFLDPVRFGTWRF